MQFSVVFLPLLGGFIFCRRCERFRYRLYRSDGYSFFFISAVSGVWLLIGSFLFLQILQYVTGAPFTLWARVDPDIPYLGTCLLAFLAAWPTAAVGNLFTDADEFITNEVARNGDELEVFFSTALSRTYDDPQPLMITLSNGKVFIGIVQSGLDPYGDRAYVQILKFASGYRNEEYGVNIVTRYADILKKIGEGRVEDAKAEDFVVTIPKREILHATFFDPNLSEHFPKGPNIEVKVDREAPAEGDE